MVAAAVIGLREVRQNNLAGFDLDIAHGQIVCVTGVSGSGKSSLAFDTLFAEGQRRYVECLSSYARQFLERMDKPQVREITGILPSVALRQHRGIRSARSTLATLCDAGELFRALFAQASSPLCPHCGAAVVRQPLALLADELLAQCDGQRAAITFALPVTSAQSAHASLAALAATGYHRAFELGETVQLAEVLTAARVGKPVEVIQDRLQLVAAERSRLVDSLAQALRRGAGIVSVFVQAVPTTVQAWRIVGHSGPFGWLRAATTRRCTACGTDVGDPSPQLFSASSAVGACETCNGFGRLIGVDIDKVIPDPSLSLTTGAIKPWSTESKEWESDELLEFCNENGIDTEIAWSELPHDHQSLVLDGKGGKRRGSFKGVRGWFKMLEGKAYKMHVRILLARYRSYTTCPQCNGARLKAQARAWRLDGLDLPAWLQLPVRQVLSRLRDLQLDEVARQAVALPLADLVRRVTLLDEIGLHYLTFDRAGRSLSGGELQRVQLVAALATGLSQVLYVLDEPSIGLHARDNDRLLRILERLKAAGNTVVVVEHDPALILAADHIIELGPGAGSDGGQLLYSGPVAGLQAVAHSPSSAYLFGRQSVDLVTADSSAEPSRLTASHCVKWLTIRGATGHNLRGEPVRFQLGALNVLCGVSGSGKSTLIENTLYCRMARHFGQPTEAPAACESIDGIEGLRTVHLVDQEVPARSSRANCATYLGIWDAIRKRLVGEPLASQRGYTAGTFSFNRGDGRCPACEGLGAQTVEMQFLSDVTLTCETCDGQRFRSEVLEITHQGWNTARFLQATSAEIAATFAADRTLREPAQALMALGLGYVRLGQSLATLSGGELQRVKIAWHLLKGSGSNGLFLLDEPSTGLHLQDVATLLSALRRLVAAGNTVIVVEHHLDLIAAADHVVELGPDGGPDGGRVVFSGQVPELLEQLSSPTAVFLRRHKVARTYQRTLGLADGERLPTDPGCIQVRGARVHNLKACSLDVPRDQFTVITGLSGSGKSSLAFDVIFAEGQRRFLDCLSPFARQYLPPTVAPDVDRLHGLLPTVAIAQRTTRGGVRSTVATLTDALPYLRLLFAKCGSQRCPRCGGEVGQQTAGAIAVQIRQLHGHGSPTLITAPAIRGRKGHHLEIIQRAQQLGHQWLVVDGALCSSLAVPELARFATHDLDFVVEVFSPSDLQATDRLEQAVQVALKLGDGTAGSRSGTANYAWSARRHCAACQRSVEAPNPRLFSFTTPAGWCPACEGTGLAVRPKSKDQALDPKSTEELAKAGLVDGGQDLDLQPQRRQLACPTCDGCRLRPEALAVLVGGQTIAQVQTLGPLALTAWLTALPWSSRDAAIAGPLLAELLEKCRFLVEVGLDYLALGRAAVSLSGGESQRLRLAAQLSSNLRGVLYVLDEPTIGLHPHDNAKVLAALRQLQARGNGLLIVEHDEDTIRSADHVIELGPGGGRAGGEVVFEGSVAALLQAPHSPTGEMLRDLHARRVRTAPRAVAADAAFIELNGIHLHNLRGASARVARGRFNVVTGVSGSGKSTLVRDVLVEYGGQIVAAFNDRKPPPAPAEVVERIAGLQGLGAIAQVDQAPIGRTPRSCPATFMAIFDTLRHTFAALPVAKVAGLQPSQFSFNTDGGRCPTCAGVGQIRVQMAFLPTVAVPCDACNGQRYGEQVLSVAYKGATIAQVLAMSVAEAAGHFSAIRAVAEPLRLAERMGLGYLQLGQSSDTLSGGEAQRLKLVTELAKRRRTETLYVLDEPSTGLHLQDVRKLLAILHDFVDRGDTLVVIEHNLDIVREADWLIDLGPGAGDKGGQVTHCGTLGDLLQRGPDCPTRRALQPQGPR
ncbi:MAG: excinuclease ABC subunit A [Myxococcales bacterium]|nr:excinuclease ABC subunit A [Myxococcales bacterium]